MTDYAEPLLSVRKAMATYEAAVLNEMWPEALEAAEKAQRDLDKLEIYIHRKLHSLPAKP